MNKVSLSDIAFIAGWIDAGCPTGEADEDEATTTIIVTENEHLARARGEMAHAPSLGHTNANRRKSGGLHIRKDVRQMSKEELDRLRTAIACMYQYNEHILDERSFDYWGRIHANSCQHGWEQFLPWHRAYLYFFEQQLQDYDENIALPYWDWTAFAAENRNTYNSETPDIGIIPEAFHCWIDEAGIARLQDTGFFTESDIKCLEATLGQTYNSGPRFLKAANIPYEFEPFTTSLGLQDYKYSDKVREIYDELIRINPMWHRNRWPGEAFGPAHYPTPADLQAILNVKTFSAFGSGPQDDHHFGALEEVHNGMHNFAGGANPFKEPPHSTRTRNAQSIDNPPFGAMTDGRVTAFDPIFWAHHSNVDRLWYVWQERNPGVNPADLNGILPPWSMTAGDTLNITKFGYEYMKDSHFYPTANHLAMTRFNSEPAGVREGVLVTHRQAEVRLHRVQKARQNGSIRVFLNAPEADADTPLENNEHYVGQVTTFAGTCVGGPGHCDVPLPRTRRFDRRPLHHNEPRNFRLDATEAVQRMVKNNAEDISVHLVAVGLDGKPTEAALYLDGVSLNFMD
jgi:tyrosinase